MKKIQVFIALFISVLVFSCQDSSNQFRPNDKKDSNRKSISEINADVTACNPSYPSINGTVLYDYHLAVSLYRAFANIHGDYKLRKQSNPNAVVNGTSLTALGWGMIPANSMGVIAISDGWSVICNRFHKCRIFSFKFNSKKSNNYKSKYLEYFSNIWQLYH